jgi:hypothetical protein
LEKHLKKNYFLLLRFQWDDGSKGNVLFIYRESFFPLFFLATVSQKHKKICRKKIGK